MEQRKTTAVIKFDGELLKETQSVLEFVQIIKDFEERQSLVVICSAINKVPGLLISIFQKCQKGELKKAEKEIERLFKIHRQVMIKMKLSIENTRQAHRELEGLLEKLYMRLCKNCKFLPADYDYVISFSDRFAGLLLVAALKENDVKAIGFDGSDIIVASNNVGHARAFIGRTGKRVQEFLSPFLDNGAVPVISGSFASNRAGDIVILEKENDDYCAVVIARALDADEIIFISEVNGVFREKSSIRFRNIFVPVLNK